MGGRIARLGRTLPAHVCAAVVCALLFLIVGPAQAAEVWTAEDCAACHEDTVAAAAHGPHAVMDRPDSGIKSPTGASCTACHGDPTKHLESGDGGGPIFAFQDDKSAQQKSERCLTCHTDTHPRFMKSPHAQAGVTCISCHSIHEPAPSSVHLLRDNPQEAAFSPSMGEESRLCATCHTDILAQFSFPQHHRVREGVVECTDCHNPHEPQSRLMLGGFKQAQCIQCHTDKGGPFVFEHGSVRGEGCTACHEPHGSPNRHQLKFQRVADLCFSCHTMPPSFHTRFTAETQCTNCHSSIHGSNFHPAFLK